ncbi:Na-K-Cl cotransporter [Candidatus Poribacteria bacterium]|nr:Na-K-Cl cotransporter [Candidatus Poribacteria bacterium]
MKEDKATLQEQVEEQTKSGRKKFGTFSGVFTPTLLTILGVIMFLREGWVVGNAGLLGGWLIILFAFTITILTGLSMSSITTNIRIGAGGAFSIISQSLGLEMGGSIGVPLYLSQALAAAMYIFGFRAGWLYIFPDHPPIAVDMIAFAVLFIISFVGANLAFRVQYFIMAIIGASLVSVLGTVFTGGLQESVTWWGNFRGAPETGFQGGNFWTVFAVFFPAATGIMAGANMSGELEEPRRSIPVGTLSAIGLSLIIYMVLAYWLARVATPSELTENYTIMIDRALWSPVVLAGLLGATFSSGLSSMVGAPRILRALGERDILPGGDWFAKSSESGQPRNASWITGGIVFIALLLRNLNAIAPLITMFFLIAYAMINVVVFIEQSLGLISFRPLFKVPRYVSFLGALGCIFAMFIVNPVFSLVAIAIVVIFYGILVRRHMQAPFEDVRSGLFASLAEWAAKKVSELASSQERAWKPNLLVPVEDPSELRGYFRFIHSITYPKGYVKLVGLVYNGKDEKLSERLPSLTRAFREEGIFTAWTLVEAEDFKSGLLTGMQVLSGVFFRPNIVLLSLPWEENQKREQDLKSIIESTNQSHMGVMLFVDHPEAGLGRREQINVWVPDQSPEWNLSIELGNFDLAVLLGYQLRRNWRGTLNLITNVEDEQMLVQAGDFMENIIDLARIPDANTYIRHCDLETCLENAPQADISVFPLGDEVDFEHIRHIASITDSACIFTSDSGEENALA